MSTFKPKKRKCRMKAPGCEKSFWPSAGDPPMRNWCRNKSCIDRKASIVFTKEDGKKRSVLAREKKAGRERLMSMSARLKRAREKAFQVYVKIRDIAWFHEMGKEPACIMCGTTNPLEFHACHFQSVGSKPELQFHEGNCHLGCSHCNMFAAQGDTQYRANLVKKVGIETVEYLENFNSTIRWDAEEVEEIRVYYREKTKELRE